MRKFLLAVTLLACLVLSKRPAEAVVNFPSTLDDNSTLFSVATGDVITNAHHNNLKDAILALEAKVGVTGSAITTSLDYKVTNPLSVDPGHTHTGSSTSFVDGSAAAPGLKFGSPVTDTTTGFFHPGVGVVALSSAGVEIVRVNGTGVGILDTNGADFPLDVAGIVRIQSASALCFGGTGAADNDTCMSRTSAHVVKLLGSAILADQAIGDNTLVLHGIAAKTGDFFRAFFLPADVNPAVQITAAGQLFFGAGGASAPDVNVYRGAADQLKTDDALNVAGTGTSSIGGAGSTVSIAGGTVSVLDAATNTITLADSTDIVLNTGTGTKIGTATTQKLAFYNSTPIAQPAATAELKGAVLSALGLVPDGGATPLDLDGGNFTTTGTVTIGSSGAAITRTLTGSASLDFAAPGVVPGCSADLTIAVANSALGNPVALGVPNASIADATQVFSAWVSAAGTVTVRSCQLANAAANPAAGTFNVRVIQ